MISPKLEFRKVNILTSYKGRHTRSCHYCQKECKEFIVIKSSNQNIFKFFQREFLGDGVNFRLCEECFVKFHDLLEDCESEGWYVLDENEFTFTEEELAEETGSG